MATAERVTRSKRDREDIDPEEDLAVKKPFLEVEAEETERHASFSSTTSGVNKIGGGKNGLNSGRRDRPGDKPAELFRKDLISAMKLADSEQLQQDEYVTIQDPWRQEWERGVQVPVNTTNIPRASLQVLSANEKLHGAYGFKLNPRKYLHALKDESFQQSIHELHETQKLSEQMCRYDLDELDVSWLEVYNEQRTSTGQVPLEEWLLEKIMEALENQCYSNMQTMIKTVEGLGIEYDENVVCDVCRSPDSEDNNEMVFCDSCDICVHQACYGIQKIPEGSWLCRVCALGVQPKCILCPRLGGAMKSTKSGSKWAHVSCSLWIPEVSIGCPEKMEPITKISQIPSSRWSLVCSICRERAGACIQCCVKTCKTSFHVTCAFHHNLDMKTILDEDRDDVSLKAYCMKHTKRKDGEVTPRKGDTPSLLPTPKKESEMTEEEKMELRSHRLNKLAEEFYLCVKPAEVSTNLQLDEEMVNFVHAYWVLKRRANFNKPLLMPKTEEADILCKQREDTLIARMKMFIHLRQDLERVRNLCYMVSRREKYRKQVYKMKEQIFHKQVALIRSDKNFHPGTREYKSVITAHRATDTLYDNPDGILNAARLLDAREREETESLVAASNDQQTQLGVKKGVGAGLRARNARLAREQRRKLEQQVLGTDLVDDYDSMSESAKTDDSCLESREDVTELVLETTKRQLQMDDGAGSERASSVRSGSLRSRRSVPSSLHEDTSEAEEPVKSSATPDAAGETNSVDETPQTVSVGETPQAVSVGETPQAVIVGETPQAAVALSVDTKGAEEQEPDPRERLRSRRSPRTSESKDSVKEEASTDQDQVALLPELSPVPSLKPSPKQSQRSAFSFIENEISDLRSQCQKLTPKEGATEDPPPAVASEIKQEADVTVNVNVNSQENSDSPPPQQPRPALVVKLRDRQKFNLPPSLTSRRNSSRDQNGRCPKSSLIVSEEIKQRVQRGLRRRQNGLHNSRRLHNSCFSRNRMLQPGRKDMGLQTHNLLASKRLTDDEHSLKDALGATSIQQNSVAYRLAGKSALTDSKVIQGLTPDPATPETRSTRRKIESDLESNVSEKLFENVDGEVSIRSREATPERDHHRGSPLRTSRGKGLGVCKVAIERRLRHKLRGHDSDRTDSDSENTFVNVVDSDDEYVPSDGYSERSSTTVRRRRKSLRKRRTTDEMVDETSRDSFASYER